MHHLVGTFMVPALHLELGSFRDERSRSRIASSLAKGEHSVLYVREDSSPTHDLTLLLSVTNPLDLVCIITDTAYPEGELQLHGLDTEYVRENDTGLPLVVHHSGGPMQQFTDLVGELRAQDVRTPVELAFFRILGAFLRTRPPKWQGFQIPEKLLEEPITQGVMKQLITRRHGILTNVPALHELNRHCCGEHQHVPGEKAG